MEPTYNSATHRRELRRAIRNDLGTTRDDAPRAERVVRASQKMATLVNLATGGRISMALIDQRTGSFIDGPTALRIARGEEPHRGQDQRTR